MLTPRYRADYTGEFVLLETKFENGKKLEKREWVENPIENHHISGRAAVIGSRNDQDRFDFTRLQRHKGGLLGKKRLQTYGSNDLWRDMKFDFIACLDPAQLQEIKAAGYYDDNIVYTTARNCIRNPGDFYLIPWSPVLDELGLAVYLAAFDGHKEIFLLGYNNDTPVVDKKWTEYVNSVFQAYRGVTFYLVGTGSNMPELWRNNPNVQTMKYRQFVTYCDV
jgi:hypothetical protein